MARMVHCIKLDKDAEGLDYPPLPGPFGKKIWLNVSKEAWKIWVGLQTMMINEYGLNMADANSRKYILDQCDKYFFGDGLVEFEPSQPQPLPPQ